MKNEIDEMAILYFDSDFPFNSFLSIILKEIIEIMAAVIEDIIDTINNGVNDSKELKESINRRFK